MAEGWMFYAAAIPAVILVGLSKGGFAGLSLISLPLLTLVAEPLRAAAIMLPILIVQDMVSLWAYRREWDRRLFVILVGGSVFGILAGAALATRVSTAAVILMVGVIAAGFVALSWFRTWQARRKAVVPPPKSAAVAPGLFWGFWLGFTSFLVNAGAPPFQVYVLPQRLPPQRYAGVQTYVFAAVNLIKLAVFVAIGQVHFDNLKTSASLFPLAIAATFGGVWLVRRVQAGVFYAIVYGLTFALGLKLMFDGARGLGWL